MGKKASIQLPTSAMIWIILGVLMFSMTFAMFRDFFDFQDDEFKDLEKVVFDVNYLDAGDSKSILFSLQFYEGMLIFFEKDEDIEITTDPTYGMSDFLFSANPLTSKKPQIYVFSPTDVCEGQSCVCAFKDMDYSVNPRRPKKALCKPLPKTFKHPKTNSDNYALVGIPAYNFGMQQTSDDSDSAIQRYNFETNATGDIFVIDRWTFFQPYEKNKQGILKTAGIVVLGAAATVATGGLAAGPIIATIGMWTTTAVTAGVAAKVAGDELSGTNRDPDSISKADYQYYEGGILAEPLVFNKNKAKKAMTNYAYLDKMLFYISVIDDDHFVVCLLPDYCDSQIHALQQELGVVVQE